jgi:formylglycine-generating enzyme required for sulfatase activity
VKRIRIFVVVASAAQLGQFATAVTIQTVPVGFAGNVPDTAVMADSTTGYGAVPYSFNIAKYDVTNSQYAAFLSAKAATADPFGLWNPDMNPSTAPGPGGIVRSGSGPFSYSVTAGYANKPVINVSWYDAIRFVNWLQNGQGIGSTENGTYTITGGGNNSGTVAIPSTSQRATWAAANQFLWLLPSENEWYKAAYFIPGSSANYYAYPFQSNTVPNLSVPPGGPNSGNFQFAVNGLTDVGSYTNSISPFGAYDMGGDVWQWHDTPTGASHGLRGASWGAFAINSAATVHVVTAINSENDLGFRVASVPEPANLTLAAIGLVVFCLCLGARRGRERDLIR